ncbi:hypothetical protein A3Q56_04403 [Intoshia linei]|uniref:DUF676 domain-containing protein n=1 Tax=Intoshia linei TaxID=1819745 RepID=A0A177B364_9BILA|nr:hypothetical protein A3Q56_04403 [Intoshia linei]
MGFVERMFDSLNYKKTSVKVTLLNWTKSPSQLSRKFAISAISRYKHWTDADFHTISHSIDFGTEVALSRCPNINNKLFLNVKTSLNKNFNSLNCLVLHLTNVLLKFQECGCKLNENDIYHFQNIIKQYGELDQNSHELFSKQNKGYSDIIYKKFEYLNKLYSSYKTNEDKTVNIVEILEWIETVCQEESKASSLLNTEFIKDLLAISSIYEDGKFETKDKVIGLISTIIANLSSYRNSYSVFENCRDLMTKLRKWQRNDCIQISMNAKKTIINLDNLECCVYPPKIVLFYPYHHFDYDFDIIFVHGINGNPYKTWRCTLDGNKLVSNGNKRWTSNWPLDLLTKDIPNCRIISFRMDNPLMPRNDYTDKEEKTFIGKSKLILPELKKIGIGKKPIIWIGHSLGGIQIKHILLMASNDERYSDIFYNTKGIAFCATPHNGSSWAKTGRALRVPCSDEIVQLSDSEKLGKLQSDFMTLVNDRKNIKLLNMMENKKTKHFMNMINFLVVPPKESDIGVSNVIIDSDHNNIVKPRDVNSKSYKEILNFINESIHQNKLYELIETFDN